MRNLLIALVLVSLSGCGNRQAAADPFETKAVTLGVDYYYKEGNREIAFLNLGMIDSTSKTLVRLRNQGWVVIVGGDHNVYLERIVD